MLIGKDVIVTINGKIKVLAKVDTGACNSSLDEDIFKSLNLKETPENKVIKNAHGEEVRDVYSLNISVNGKKFLSEVNISDRKNMTYKMILGREDIEKIGAIIDIRESRIKRFKDFSKIEEGVFKNILISSLISLGVITHSEANTIKPSEKIDKLETENKDAVDIINFLKRNNLELDRKYNFTEIKNKFESQCQQNFEKAIRKLRPNLSPISTSVFTFSNRDLGINNIPMISIDVRVSPNLKISFWDSGWFKGTNVVGGGISINF